VTVFIFLLTRVTIAVHWAEIAVVAIIFGKK
jgi:hypothetical protein